MRCLYCGKGLALLTRLRGGGEFCSDAHRIKYQEEYNQLALSRLLQAQPPDEPPAAKSADNASSPNGKSANATTANGAASSQQSPNRPANGTPATVSAPAVAAARNETRSSQSTPAVATLERPSAAAREPAPKPRPEIKAPAPIARFIPDMPPLQSSETRAMAAADPELAVILRPECHVQRDAQDAVVTLDDAPPQGERIAMTLRVHAADSIPAIRNAGVEVRASGRLEPVIAGVDADLTSGYGTLEWARPGQPLDFSLPAAASSGDAFPPASSWLGNAQEFQAAPLELGDLGRLGFAVEGSLPLEEALGTPTSAVEPAPIPEPQPAPAAPMPIAPQRQELSVLAGIQPVHPEPVQIDPSFLRALANLELSSTEPSPASGPTHPENAQAATLPEAPAPEPPEQPSSQVPERVTRALPLTLDGFPPARAKSTPVFGAGLRVVPDAQIPSTGTLPLRPVMLLAPAPVTAPAPAATVQAKSAPGPYPAPEKETQSRPAEARPVKPEPEEPKALEPKAKPEPKIETKPEPRHELRHEPKAPASAEPKPESKPVVDPKRGRDAIPAPMAAPVTSVDLGLPSLQLDVAAESRKPAPTVIVVVLLVIAAIGFGVYKLGLSKPKSAPQAPAAPINDVVETGTPLEVSQAGWIDDWAPQPPNPKVLRVLSILRGSLPLSDYRMEFEAQIETKALGWVFRALNQRNYYVIKLEVVKPGIEPEVEVVHFAMIDGEEQTRVRVPLKVKVRVDTTYKIRFDALGDRFTTYVQDQKVDEWTDNRLGRGGAGLYRERGEGALLKGTVRITLIAKKK